MWSFFVEFASRSFSLFLSSISATALGFLAGNIVQFFVYEFATWLAIWVIRGKEAMLARKRENFLIGAVAYVIAVMTIYGPIFVRQMWNIDHAIWEEAKGQPIPAISRYLPPPPFAVEKSPAFITLSLVPQNGFSFDLGGPYKLENKRQYLLVFGNSTHALKFADIAIQFPYPVEAQRVLRVTGIHDFTFQPMRPVINLIGAQLENNGCLGRWSYDLHARSIQGHGHAEISLILNGHSAAHPTPGMTIDQKNGYIAGSFGYTYHGRNTKRDYYAELNRSQDTILKMTLPQSQMPLGLKKSSGFTVLEGPCIPDGSLIAP